MANIALITGASRGIGRATAKLLGARGWSVGVNFAHNEHAAQEVVAEVFQAGGRACAIRGNVADETDVIAMFDAVESKLGCLNALVNNAGIVAPSMPLADMSVARLRQMFDVNVLGAYLCAREARDACRRIAAVWVGRSSMYRLRRRDSVRRTNMWITQARKGPSTR